MRWWHRVRYDEPGQQFPAEANLSATPRLSQPCQVERPVHTREDDYGGHPAHLGAILGAIYKTAPSIMACISHFLDKFRFPLPPRSKKQGPTHGRPLLVRLTSPGGLGGSLDGVAYSTGEAASR